MATVAAAALGPEAGPSAAGEEQCATYRKFSQGLSKDQTHELTPWVAYVYKLDEIYWSDSALVDDEDHTSTGGTAAEFQQAVRHGRVSAAAQVWLEGMPAWQTLGECCALWLVAIAWNQPPRRAPGAMRKRFSTNVKVVIAVDRIAHATMTAEMASGSPMARMLREKGPDATPDVDLAPEATAGAPGPVIPPESAPAIPQVAHVLIGETHDSPDSCEMFEIAPLRDVYECNGWVTKKGTLSWSARFIHVNPKCYLEFFSNMKIMKGPNGARCNGFHQKERRIDLSTCECARSSTHRDATTCEFEIVEKKGSVHRFRTSGTKRKDFSDSSEGEAAAALVWVGNINRAIEHAVDERAEEHAAHAVREWFYEHDRVSEATYIIDKLLHDTHIAASKQVAYLESLSKEDLGELLKEADDHDTSTYRKGIVEGHLDR